MMGLDMYLYKVPKIEGLSLEQLESFDNQLEEVIKKGDEVYELLKPHIKEVGEFIRWKSIFDKVGQWRKANQIHQWFVVNIQDGMDRCELHEVSKEKIEELYLLCQSILNNKDKAEQLLPTQSGFFFGSTDYDEYYFDDIEETVKILEPIVEHFDYQHYYLAYRSSW